MKPADFERLLTVAEVASVMGTCERTVRRRIKSGDLPALRDGRQLRIRPSDLRTYHLERLIR